MRSFVALVFTIFFLIVFIPTILASNENIHVYKYTTEVSVGIDEPSKHVSKFNIDGNLKIQKQLIDDLEDKNTYMIALTDLKHSAFYGEESSRIQNMQPIAKNLQELENPFLAIYSQDGEFEAIKTYTTETKEIENIKKSIAIKFQLNWKTPLNLISKNGTNEFILQEHTVYGFCNVKYFTTELENIEYLNRSITFMKSYKPEECSNFLQNIRGYNAYYKDYIQIIKNQMNTDVSCMYKVEGLQYPIIKTIMSAERYEWNMNSEMLYSSVTIPYTTQRHFVDIKQSMVWKHITHLDVFNSANKSTNIDQNSNMNKNKNEIDRKKLNQIKDLFIKANKNMNEHCLIQHKPNIVNQQIFNRIQSALEELSIEHFKILYNEMGDIDLSNPEKMRSIFIQIVPYIGTKPSLLFLKDVIINKNISDTLAIRLIKTFPSFIRQPSKELLLDFENFILINNGLSPSVKKNCILSYAHIISRVYKDSSTPDDVMMEKYLKHFNNAFEFAETIEMKLVYVHAIGNTRSHEAIKYLIPILLRRDSPINDVLVTNRIRVAVIHSLSQIITSNDDTVIQNLKHILVDTSESRNLRIAAYDVLFNIAQLDFNELDQMDLTLSLIDDEHMRNYHRSNIKILLLSFDALPKEMHKLAIRNGLFNISPTMSKSRILHLNDKFKLFIVNFLKPFMISLRLSSNEKIRYSDVLDNGETITLKHEILENTKKKIEVSQGLYWYSNVNLMKLKATSLQSSDISIDLWIKSVNWISDVYSFDKLKSTREKPFDFFTIIEEFIDTISNKPYFDYETFTSFSVSTGVGINAMFEYKIPSLKEIKMKIDIHKQENTINVTSNLRFMVWEDGYIDTSVYNPNNALIHAVRRTKVIDMIVPNKISTSYDNSSNTWNIIYDVIVDGDPDSCQNDNGLSIYTAVNVMIDTKNGIISEDSCDACGYQLVTTLNQSQKLTNEASHKSNHLFGIWNYTSVIYDCDLRLSHGFFDTSTFINEHTNRCGILIKQSPHQNISQLVIKINSELHLLQSPEMPWYSLPGFKLFLKSSLRTRNTFNAKIENLGILNIDAGTTQGYILSNFKLKFSKKRDDNRNIVFCYDMQNNYPNVTDTQMPSEATLLFTNIDMRATLGFSLDDSCSDSIFSIDNNMIGKLSDDHLQGLVKHARNSRCAQQKETPLFAHPPAYFPLTWDCIYESILNTTLRHYTLNINYKNIPTMFLITNIILQQLKHDWPGVNIKLVSPISRRLFGTSHLTYEIDYPVNHDSLYNVTLFEKLSGNVFYSKSFITKFMNDNIKVTNVFPKIILFDKNKVISNANLSDWKRIYNDKKSDVYSIYVKLMDDNNLAAKMNFKGHELIFESTTRSVNDSTRLSNDSFVKPQIYFNKKSVEFNERLFLPIDEINSGKEYIFSLLKVGDFIMVQPMDSQITLYYSINSVTILRKV